MSTEASLDSVASVALSDEAVRHQAAPSILLSSAMEAVLNIAPNPACIVDRQGRYLHVGAAGARI